MAGLPTVDAGAPGSGVRSGDAGAEPARPGAGRWSWGRPLRAVGWVAAAVGLFVAYLAMSRTQPTNADGASQALQAWDMLHGNVLLAGWTVSDVPFYTNELLVLAAAEAVHGLNADVVHICAAVLYTLLVLAVAVLARGRSRGVTALVRVVLALAVILVPQIGLGVSVLLLSPDHTGTALPLLVALIVIERASTDEDGSPRVPGRWLAYAVGLLLALGEISDPLMLYIGALPVALAGALRLWRAGARRPRQWRGPDARLVAAAVTSVVVSSAVLLGAEAAGGAHVHSVGVGLANPLRLLDNLRTTAVALSANFGAYFHDRAAGLETLVGVVRLAGMVATLVVVAMVAARLLRSLRSGAPVPGPAARNSTVDGDLVDELLVLGVLVNVGAFVGSTIPFDPSSARQVAPVLFLGAALLGRYAGPGLAALLRAPRRPRVRLGAAAVAAVALVAVAGEFTDMATRPAVPDENHDVAAYLRERNLTYGLGGFWTANEITLQTGGRIQVAPVIGETGVYGYRWLSRLDWYDPARHDARFYLIRKDQPLYGTEAAAVAQFGRPVQRADLGRVIVLEYDHNLLVGLPAMCQPGTAPSMAECP